MYLEVFVVGVLAGMSPGPDFFIVVRNSLGFGLRTGIATALGVAFALIVHITYTILGFALILQSYPSVFSLVQLLGALYLLRLGIHAVRSSAVTEIGETDGKKEGNHQVLKGFREGFLCNILNPKAALFFLSIFSQFITADTPGWKQWLYGGEIILAVGLWFVLLSMIISNARFRDFYRRYSYWFDRLLGGVLIYFSVRIFYSVIKNFV